MADWLRKPGRSASENGTQDSKDSFNKFQDQTKDAWDCADDEVKTINVSNSHFLTFM